MMDQIKPTTLNTRSTISVRRFRAPFGIHNETAQANPVSGRDDFLHHFVSKEISRRLVRVAAGEKI
jgi:hypothetical protein